MVRNDQLIIEKCAKDRTPERNAITTATVSPSSARRRLLVTGLNGDHQNDLSETLSLFPRKDSLSWHIYAEFSCFAQLIHPFSAARNGILLGNGGCFGGWFAEQPSLLGGNCTHAAMITSIRRNLLLTTLLNLPSQPYNWLSPWLCNSSGNQTRELL